MNNIILIISLLITPAVANAEEQCNQTCQKNLIQEYHIKLDKIAQAGSTIEDIDNFLALFNNDVRYVHVEYGADFNKITWRKAFIKNLKAGAYKNPKYLTTKITKYIHGHNYAAIEKTGHYFSDSKKTFVETKPRLVMFQFKDKKINTIKEYWVMSSE